MATGSGDTRTKRRPKVGVVVSSGGLKAMSSIALFEFLDEAKIQVDLLIGCSGGSMVVGGWACGYNADEMRELSLNLWANKKIFSKIDYRSLLSIAGLPFGRFDKTCGLINPDVAHQMYRIVYGDRMIEDLRIRTLMQATDVLTGEPVLLCSGLLREAVYASGAILPLLPPLCIGGRWLMDGVYSSPLPVLEAVNRGMDVVIAMTYEEHTTEESKGFVPYFLRSVGYSHQWLRRSQTALAVDLHHHEIIFINIAFNEFIGLRASDKIPGILEAGKVAIANKKEEILAGIQGFK